ncbi:MAG: PD-(D/E)XK nuclease family protein, partial [Geitlerinemataceae cyanobacterium]
LWSEFEPAVGRESFHCDMKRGFNRARKREPQVAELLAQQDSIPIQIGLLAQMGVYEFHRNSQLLVQSDGVEKVAEILQLYQKPEEVRKRVHLVLQNYYQNPILVDKEILKLSRTDEGFPEPILMQQGSYTFNFFAAIDCIFQEPDGTLHILDFKTGKSDIDRRQAYLYLLAVRYLYPRRSAIASFYNLETGERSEPIQATSTVLTSFQIEIARLAKQHQQDLKRYRYYREEFERVFPPNPGLTCRYCPFSSICAFSDSEVAA